MAGREGGRENRGIIVVGSLSSSSSVVDSNN